MSLFSEDFYMTVALIYLVLPISSAFCEWRFSAVKHMKNDAYSLTIGLPSTSARFAPQPLQILVSIPFAH
jgi:hypothetical protein